MTIIDYNISTDEVIVILRSCSTPLTVSMADARKYQPGFNALFSEFLASRKPADIKIGDYYPEGDYLPEGDGNSLYDWIQARKCQCGSEATYGADCSASLHSDWCPKYSKES